MILLLGLSSVDAQNCHHQSSGGLISTTDPFNTTIYDRPITLEATLMPNMTSGILNSFGLTSLNNDLYPGYIQLVYDAATYGQQGLALQMSDGRKEVSYSFELVDFLQPDENLDSQYYTYRIDIDDAEVLVYFAGNDTTPVWNSTEIGQMEGNLIEL